MMKWIRLILILILSSSIIGCSTTQMVTPDRPLVTHHDRIRVYLKDNRIVMFDPDEYQIQEDSDSSYIQGVGTQTIDGLPGETRFRGSINRGDIKEIQVTQPTSFSRIAVPVTLVFLVLVALSIGSLAGGTQAW